MVSSSKESFFKEVFGSKILRFVNFFLKNAKHSDNKWNWIWPVTRTFKRQFVCLPRNCIQDNFFYRISVKFNWRASRLSCVKLNGNFFRLNRFRRAIHCGKLPENPLMKRCTGEHLQRNSSCWRNGCGMKVSRQSLKFPERLSFPVNDMIRISSLIDSEAPLPSSQSNQWNVWLSIVNKT